MTGHRSLAAVALSAIVAVTSLMGCAADTGDEDSETLDDEEALTSGDPKGVDIGFNAGHADQFDYFDDFYGKNPSPEAGPRLCHAYTWWRVGEAPVPPAVTINAQAEPLTRAHLTYWFERAKGHCDEALISFKARYSGKPPKESDYKAAIEAFFKADFPKATGFKGKLAFVPWNEPNNKAKDGTGLIDERIEPELAARYYLVVERECKKHGCKVAAGDLASNGNMWNDFNVDDKPASYLDRYKAEIAKRADDYGVPSRPKYFAFHPWHDANAYLNTGNHCGTYAQCTTRRLLKSMSGSWSKVELWDTEVGVDQTADPIPDDEQACGAAFLMRLTVLGDRVTRLYYTRLHGGGGQLIDKNHKARPALGILQRRETSYKGHKCK